MDTGYKKYWVTWAVLLVLTLVMLGAEAVGLPKGLAVVVLVAAMLVKATLIGWTFMHLKFETLLMVGLVIFGLFFASVSLYLGLIPDGIRVGILSR